MKQPIWDSGCKTRQARRVKDAGKSVVGGLGLRKLGQSTSALERTQKRCHPDTGKRAGEKRRSSDIQTIAHILHPSHAGPSGMCRRSLPGSLWISGSSTVQQGQSTCLAPAFPPCSQLPTPTLGVLQSASRADQQPSSPQSLAASFMEPCRGLSGDSVQEPHARAAAVSGAV